MEVKRSGKRWVRSKAWQEDGCGEPKIVALSAADRLPPFAHVRVLYAYEARLEDDVFGMLEEGLSEVLTRYEEWSGRLGKDANGRPAIVLSDAGVAWIQAEASVTLRDAMPFPSGRPMLELTPSTVGAEELLLVQVTRFKCGGFTLATAYHHYVADGSGATSFLNAWGAVVRSKISSVLEFALSTPLHDRSALSAPYPSHPRFEHENKAQYQKPHWKGKSDHLVTSPSLASRTVHFHPDMLRKLKAEAMKDLEPGKYYTNYECLASHIWRCMTRARGLSKESESKITAPVDCRTKLLGKLPDNYFGNVVVSSGAKSTVKDLLERPLSHTTELLHKSIKRIDKEYIFSLIDFVELQQRQKDSNPMHSVCPEALSPDVTIASWAHMALYETDLGWGKPLFVGPPSIPFEGLVVLFPSHTHDGSIDAAVGLFESDMDKFEEYVVQLP